MPAIVLPFVRAESYAMRSKPVRILTLDEVRTQMDAPPAGPVEWVGTCKDDGRQERTWAQLWMSARDILAAMLGVPADRVECVRADEQRLPGNGAA